MCKYRLFCNNRGKFSRMCVRFLVSTSKAVSAVALRRNSNCRCIKNFNLQNCPSDPSTSKAVSTLAWTSSGRRVAKFFYLRQHLLNVEACEYCCIDKKRWQWFLTHTTARRMCLRLLSTSKGVSSVACTGWFETAIGEACGLLTCTLTLLNSSQLKSL